MGNRAVITLEDHHHCQHPVALYVHWHGGLESALAFVQYTWDVFRDIDLMRILYYAASVRAWRNRQTQRT